MPDSPVTQAAAGFPAIARRDPAQLRDSAHQLRGLIAKGGDHRALYEVFLAVRDAAAKILEHTTIADVIKTGKAKQGIGGKIVIRKKATGA